MSAFTTFLGAPIDSVGRSGGTELSPGALRQLGLVDVLGGSDGGDISGQIRGEVRDPVTGILASDDVLTVTREIRSAVAERMGAGERPFIAGGCCSELVGALAGAHDALGRIGLAYLDGHLDLYDGVTSPTGEAADMPVSVVLGFGPDAWREAGGGASVAAHDVAILGYRDLEESLGYGMRHPDSVDGLVHRSNEDLRAAGPEAVGKDVANMLGVGPGRYWVHLDVDVLDEEVFPATDYLMPGGLTLDELGSLMRPLMTSDAVIGASVGCYNPEKDPDQRNGTELVDLWRSLI